MFPTSEMQGGNSYLPEAAEFSPVLCCAVELLLMSGVLLLVLQVI